MALRPLHLPLPAASSPGWVVEYGASVLGGRCPGFPPRYGMSVRRTNLADLAHGRAPTEGGGEALRRAMDTLKSKQGTRRPAAAADLLQQAVKKVTRGRVRLGEKTLRAALTVAFSQKAMECHERRCAELGEKAACDLGPEDLKLAAARALFELWTGNVDDTTDCQSTEQANTPEGGAGNNQENRTSKPSEEPSAADAATNESDATSAEAAMLTQTQLRAALFSMDLTPTQELVDEFVGELAQPFRVETNSVQRATPTSLHKERFIARLLELVGPDETALLETEARRWAPWSVCGFACDCLPWGSTKVIVSKQGDVTVQRNSRALLCRAGYKSVDIFDIPASRWMQIKKNISHSSAVVGYFFEALVLFLLCASLFHGHYTLMTAVSTLVGLAWMGFRLMFLLCRRTGFATIYQAALPTSYAGGSAGDFEVRRSDCLPLLDAFKSLKVGQRALTNDEPIRFTCPRPSVFFLERCIKLNAPHTLELGPKQEHYIIEKIADATLPCCRSFSQTTWHVGLIPDIAWIHTHVSERDLGTLCRWLLKGLAAALLLGFLIASCIPECREESPCKDELLNAQIGRLPPFANVSATDCRRPFDFTGYEVSEQAREEQHTTPSGISDAEMECERKALQGHCRPTHPGYDDMLTLCRPICGLCLEENDDLHCDERCREYSCGEFTCGAMGMRRPDDAATFHDLDGITPGSIQVAYRQACSFAGGGANDGVCDEGVGWCLPGTDWADCHSAEHYVDHLHSQYGYTEVLEHRHLHWYAAIAEANDHGCRIATVLERCATCRSPDFACGPYNASSGFPDAQASCLEIESDDLLHETPWCRAMSEQMFPACACLPPHLRALPSWRIYVAISSFVLVLIWIPIIWRWCTYRRCYTEFGTIGVDTTKTGHALKFHTMQGSGRKIAMQVMEQKLGRPLNHELVKTYTYKVPAMRRMFNVGRVENLEVHADYLVVETVNGHWCCNFWSRSPAQDFYYVLLKDTSFVESGQVGEPCTSNLAYFLLGLGFGLMFSVLLGGLLSYLIKRFHIPAESMTLVKWLGLLLGILFYFIFRACSGKLHQQFLHVGCVAGGTQRGRRNPHGGTSPFYVQIRDHHSADDIDEMKDVIRATRRESKATTVLGHRVADEVDLGHRKVCNDSDANDADDQPELARTKSQAGLRNSMRDIEQNVKDGLMDEYKTVVTAKDITLRAIDETYRRLDTDHSGTLSADEIASAVASLGIEMDARAIMEKWDVDCSGSLDRAEFVDMMLEILDPNLHISSFSAPEYCPMNFYGIDFDWMPWGKRSTALSRVQADLRGKTGLCGRSLFTNQQSVEVEVPRMRWLLLDQNPATSGKFNSYLSEALVLYLLRSKTQIRHFTECIVKSALTTVTSAGTQSFHSWVFWKTTNRESSPLWLVCSGILRD